MKFIPFIASAGILAAVTGAWQQKRIQHLDSEISSHRLQPPAASEVSPRRPSSAESPGMSPTAGAESIPEAIELIKTLEKMSASQKGTFGSKIDPEDPAKIRIGEILGSMSLDSALKLIDAIDDPPLRNQAFLEFLDSNPGMALQMKIAFPDRKLGTAGAVAYPFRLWSLMDPGAAIRWFRAAEASHSEIATDMDIRFCASMAEAGIDPSRCVRCLPTLLPELIQPGKGTQEGIATAYAESMANNQVRLQFLQALNEISRDSGNAAALTGFRKEFLKKLNTQLYTEPVPEAISLMDATYTLDEKQVFAIGLAQILHPSPPLNQEWFPWLASLDLPGDSRHPLALIAMERAMSGTLSEPNWLDQLPAGEVKNQVIVTCVKENRYDSALALRYLSYLPAGPEKDELAASRGSAAKPSAGKTRATIGPSEGE